MTSTVFDRSDVDPSEHRANATTEFGPYAGRYSETPEVRSESLKGTSTVVMGAPIPPYSITNDCVLAHPPKSRNMI